MTEGNNNTTTLDIPVLYCSQTGNASDAAEELSKTLPHRLSTSLTTITSSAMTMDDFLEIALRTPSSSSKTTTTAHSAMPPIFCVVCSSYGVGQAPLGGYKFRDLCEYILASKDDGITTLYEGCQYAILGLGDSKYTTYFLNPIALDGGLSKAGAVRLGRFGRADVSGTDGIQADVIEEWCETIIGDLSLAVREREAKMSGGDGGEEEGKVREVMAERTLGICAEIFEDWEDGQIQQKKSAIFGLEVVLIPIALVCIVGFFFMKTTDEDATAAEL